MQTLFTLMVVVQVVSALVIIGLVLLQHGKGADMGASFGSGASGSLFGATGSASFLTRATAVAATLFFAATLGLVAAGNSRKAAPDLMENLPAAKTAASASAVGVAASAAASASVAASALGQAQQIPK